MNLVRIATWSEVPDRTPTAAFAHDGPALVEVTTDAEPG
jgi:hypothetical protein